MNGDQAALSACALSGCDRAADHFVTVEGSFGSLDRFSIDVCGTHVAALDLVAVKMTTHAGDQSAASG